MLKSACSSAMMGMGVTMYDLGVMTTPCVAYLASHLGVDFGIMISASHNKFSDNGIKFFDDNGYKLADEIEAEIEAEFDSFPELAKGKDIGKLVFDHNRGQTAYKEYLNNTVPNDLEGLKICVDPANGAAYQLGPSALRQAGAEVTVINDSPNGTNINDKAGSTHPERLQAIVKTGGFDLGISYDGDADRCIAVDENGEIINGDQIMGILALDKFKRGTLNKDTLVLTVMSNLGLRLALEKLGIKYEVTGVGDRYVLEKMLEQGYNLGGEQSGHIINLDHSTTGDGILTSLMLAAALIESGKTASELASQFPQLPQSLINVEDVNKKKLEGNLVIQDAIVDFERVLGHDGRVLLRASGTENLVRVMVEASTDDLALSIAKKLSSVVKSELT
jgi:phosphoglucosamine mutase